MPTLFDTLLDRSLVGGYSRVGYALRSHAFGGLPRMDGQTAAVTGATSGLGLAAAIGFARLGARVILVARSEERGEQARAQVREHGPDVDLVLADLSSLADLRRVAATLADADLDVLVNNAGVLTEERETSVDGNELTLATNVLGPFLLTDLLPDARRVVTVSSGGMYAQKLDVEDLQSEHGAFSGTKAYAKTKRAEVVLTELWAQRRRATPQRLHAMHPGWVDTPGLAASLPSFHRLTGPLLRTPRQGADTIVWLGATDQPSGRFWHDRAPRPTHYVPWTKESDADRGRVWDACVALTAA
ncbi:FabG-like 3-oxoacyl-(acyl-carrier-protein) reductase [Baekduia alba]|uniref:SDR family NAD(P)-dependent oxidoreductase n=1 Tax=Baekduia alba TaxID=2997333 RepID=UPI0023418B04|nr:SDR family NAD(P)-dependent oxidoreductase [Baekduia alba]WCB93564.1 FabG-like 3-oxoacyl-(acyl-carrier-protein) reductase [Baekduia alba]